MIRKTAIFYDNEAMYYLDFLKRSGIIFTDDAGSVCVKDKKILADQIIEFIKRTLEGEKMTINTAALDEIKLFLDEEKSKGA